MYNKCIGIQYFMWGKLDHSLATNLFGTHWKSVKPLDSTRNEGTPLGHEIVYPKLIKGSFTNKDLLQFL